MRKEISVFAQRLKQYREKLNITRIEMAEYLGITPTAYGAYELGTREPKLSALYKISTFLKVTPNDLLISENSLVLQDNIKSEIYIQQLRQIGFEVQQIAGNIFVTASKKKWKFKKDDFIKIMREAEGSERYSNTLREIYSLAFDERTLAQKEIYLDFAVQVITKGIAEKSSDKIVWGGKNRDKLIEAISKGMSTEININKLDDIPEDCFTLEKLIHDKLPKKENKTSEK